MSITPSIRLSRPAFAPVDYRLGPGPKWPDFRAINTVREHAQDDAPGARRPLATPEQTPSRCQARSLRHGASRGRSLWRMRRRGRPGSHPARGTTLPVFDWALEREQECRLAGRPGRRMQGTSLLRRSSPLPPCVRHFVVSATPASPETVVRLSTGRSAANSSRALPLPVGNWKEGDIAIAAVSRLHVLRSLSWLRATLPSRSVVVDDRHHALLVGDTRAAGFQ